MAAKKENIVKYAIALKSVIAGSTWASAAKENNVSVERMRQWWKRIVRIMVSPDMLDVDLPAHDYWNIEEVRNYKEFWLERLDKLIKKHSID